MTIGVRTRPFTVEEFHRMAEVGILGEDDRVELIDGEIIPMTPIGPRHASFVNRLNRLLIQRGDPDVIVHVQNPLQLNERSELYPDLALLRPRTDQYRTANPRPGDVLLVVEVADTSLQRDRTEKLPRYAEVGVPEVWLIDVEREQIVVHRQPRSKEYTHVETFGRGTSVRPELLPTLVISLDEIFS